MSGFNCSIHCQQIGLCTDVIDRTDNIFDRIDILIKAIDNRKQVFYL